MNNIFKDELFINREEIITKVYAEVSNTTITNLMFEYSDGTRDYSAGYNFKDINNMPIVFMGKDCFKLGTETARKNCQENNLKDSQVIITPQGFNTVSFGYAIASNKTDYIFTDISFYKDSELLGTFINNNGVKSNNIWIFILLIILAVFGAGFGVYYSTKSTEKNKYDGGMVNSSCSQFVTYPTI
jgi:hypothetical protein